MMPNGDPRYGFVYPTSALMIDSYIILAAVVQKDLTSYVLIIIGGILTVFVYLKE